MKELIHFAHGNGFPSLCYRQLFNALEVEHDICWIDKLGHDPKFPVDENWYNLVDEVIHSIQRQSMQPVIAMGHSLGAVLSLVAAIERPDLIKAVLMIDAPMIGRFKSSMVQLAKALGVIDRVTPARRTRGRRTRWQEREQILNYINERELFKTFCEPCKQDYIEYGLVETQDGYELAFDRHVEYKIYRTLPHTLHQYEGMLNVPAFLIYGNKSTVVHGTDVRYMKKKYNIEAQALPGTHMLPLETPKIVAEIALNWIRQLDVL